MFVTLTPDPVKLADWNRRKEQCKAESPDDMKYTWDRMKHILDCELEGHPGFYVEWNEYGFEDSKEFEGKRLTYDEKYKFFMKDDDIFNWKCQYGVADTIEQIIENFQEAYDDPDRKFVVLVHAFPVEEADANDKFYKQGPYIGNCCEIYEDGQKGDFDGSKLTPEVEKQGYIIGYHIYPLPGTKKF